MLKIAAVQPRMQIGAVDANLRRAEDLIRSAHAEHAPAVIVLPEAYTSPNVYGKIMDGVARRVDGEPFQLMRRLARELDCVICAGSLAVRGEDAYGTYVMHEPSGAAYLHDKDQPSAFECNYYRHGDDDGVHETSLGRVGLISGWEWSRMRTARRLRDARVQLVLGGMCWPSWPDWALTRRWIVDRERPIFRDWARQTPGWMARLTGAAAVMASHVGDAEFESPLLPGVPWRAPVIGETQICERDGTILGRITYEEGEGHIAAEVRVADPEPLDPVRDRYWIPVVPAILNAGWRPLNGHGRVKYELNKRLGRHSWQREGLTGFDLPDRVPAEPQPVPVSH